jgi:hypothetical protein
MLIIGYAPALATLWLTLIDPARPSGGTTLLAILADGASGITLIFLGRSPSTGSSN